MPNRSSHIRRAGRAIVVVGLVGVVGVAAACTGAPADTPTDAPTGPPTVVVAPTAGEHGVGAASTPSTGAWQSPVDGIDVLRGFEQPPQPWAAGHRGVDLAATAGEPVTSPAPGVVTFVGQVAGRGVVTVAHGPLLSSFEPVASDLTVGVHVAVGERLGVVATGTHCGPWSCVHWGVRSAPTTYVDPLALLGIGPVVLLE